MAHYHAFWKNQPGRGMARTKAVIDKAIEATMTPAVKSPAGVMRTLAFSDTLLPTRQNRLVVHRALLIHTARN